MSSPNAPAPKRTPDPTEIPFLLEKALVALTALGRDNALQIACSVCDKSRCQWVRELYRSGALESRCLGRFDLHNPILPEMPWPSAVFLVRGKVMGTVKACALCLHIDPRNPSAWDVTDAEPVQFGMEDGVLTVNGRRFCGDKDGPRGLLNGDGPIIRERRDDDRVRSQPPPPPSLTGESPAPERMSGHGEASYQTHNHIELEPVLGVPSSQKLEFALLLLRFLLE